ncbi:Putative protein [Zobellia galactanivorans]|uniref:Uncharacterized protein n=1 Tax=Zobellia galactanivorans (strain DSM 12802 / CCUG 47099 / CIP 106680 / NCIMB 13871 / Dsij) TaxID=63186 RepID=G0L188_ZOBGA|nr:Putative protein [Zobellia galactanivorans]
MSEVYLLNYQLRVPLIFIYPLIDVQSRDIVNLLLKIALDKNLTKPIYLSTTPLQPPILLCFP